MGIDVWIGVVYVDKDGAAQEVCLGREKEKNAWRGRVERGQQDNLRGDNY